MTQSLRIDLLTWLALALGAGLLAATIAYLDVSTLIEAVGRLQIALPLVLVASGLWHLLRTAAWAVSFPDQRPPFGRLIRVRLAAEAFSFVTIRGVAGEPLKVLLLSADVSPRNATAAVALERIAYTVVTIVVLAISAAVVLVSLNLEGVWFRTFRALFVVAAVITAFVTFVISGRGTYLRRSLERLDQVTGRSTARGTVGRFVIDVEQRLLEFARESRGRLGVLVLIETLCFGLMALEVWVVALAIGVPLSWTEAVAVETFSRVASVLSAFIPANLGALEASNVAAVTAMGAEAAAAPVAVARRLRGLWWAILGFAIYPRRIPRTGSGSVAPSTRSRSRHRTHTGGIDLLYIADGAWTDVSPLDEIGGLSFAARVLRSAERARIRRVVVWAPATGREIAAAAGRRAPDVALLIATTPDEWSSAWHDVSGVAVITVGPGTVISPRLLMRAQEIASDSRPSISELQDVPSGPDWRSSGVYAVSAAVARDIAVLGELLRQRAKFLTALPQPDAVADGRAVLVAHAASRHDLPATEAMVRRAIYKPTDSYLARFNRRISLPISIWLIRHTRLSANAISVAVISVGLAAAWLLSDGAYWTGVAGATLSLLASILDGSDGEIARLTHTDSDLGCWIETLGDYTYYLAIFAGLTVGVTRDTGSPVFAALGAGALAGAVITFVLLVVLRRHATAGRPEQLNQLAKQHLYADGTRWAWLVAKISFVATRSTMPYGIVAFALLDALPIVVALACLGAHVYWISLAVKWPTLIGRRAPVTVEQVEEMT